MNIEAAVNLAQQSIILAIEVSAPIILTGMVVGVIVSVFQAATSIQEQSLLFVPKVAALFGALFLLGGWMLTRVVDFTRSLIMSLPDLVRG